MIRKWIERFLRLPGPLPDSLGTCEVLHFVIQRGLGAYCRGFLKRLCFKNCGPHLFIGKNCRLYFPRFISLGAKVVIGPNVTVNGLSQKGIRLGSNVHLREYGWIQATSQLHAPGVGLSIGENTYIGPYAYLGAGGGIEIGKNVVMGAHVQILAENHCFDDLATPIREQGVSRKGIRIGDNVWIGNHVIILDGIEIPEGCIVGAGAVVTHSVPPNSVVAGNPAKVLKSRT